LTDTLLNVFLAIAVDNLGNAQALTAAEERAELSGQVHKNCSVWQKKATPSRLHRKNLMVAQKNTC